MNGSLEPWPDEQGDALLIAAEAHCLASLKPLVDNLIEPQRLPHDASFAHVVVRREFSDNFHLNFAKVEGHGGFCYCVFHG